VLRLSRLRLRGRADRLALDIVKVEDEALDFKNEVESEYAQWAYLEKQTMSRELLKTEFEFCLKEIGGLKDTLSEKEQEIETSKAEIQNLEAANAAAHQGVVHELATLKE